MITTQNLSKRYGEKLAVDDLTFSVAPGAVLGFLGANGAGKSTTMRMIAGFVAPSAGRVSVCGHDIERAPVAAKSCMGYLPEGAPSYGEMTVAEFLDFVADIRGLTGARRRERRGVVTERLALALVIVSTHILEEVHEVCTRAIIIADGRIVADETPAALESRSRYHHAVSLRFDKPEQLAAARREIAGLPEVADVELDEREMRLTAIARAAANALPAVSALIVKHDWDVPELHLESGRLDEVFRTLTQPQAAPSPAAPAPAGGQGALL